MRLARSVARKVVALTFFLHLTLAIASFMTMDLDLGGESPRRFFDAVVDSYERVGFGMLPVGILVVTAVLGVVWLPLRVRAKLS